MSFNDRPRRMFQRQFNAKALVKTILQLKYLVRAMTSKFQRSIALKSSQLVVPGPLSMDSSPSECEFDTIGDPSLTTRLM